MPTGYRNDTSLPTRLGAHHTEETKRKMKTIIAERHPHAGAKNGMFGRERSEEERQRISEATKAKMTPEICAYLSELAKKRIGSLNSFWKGGWVNPGYPKEFSEELKDRIRARDNYQCQACGVPQAECIEVLHVHHIDGNRNNISEDNLISLCRTCHTTTRWHPLAEILATKGGDQGS